VKTTNTTTRLNILLQGTIAWKLPQQDWRDKAAL
jgi:hypothetical protein